jgi:predicted unusual protein kinase regulating ubiquinone biosynthesis (AarF/ABC1/UbiB family)
MDASTPAPAPLRPLPRASVLPSLRRATATVRFKLRTAGVEPALRLLACIAGIALRQLLGRLGDLLAAPEERPERLARRQRRSAEAVAKTLGTLKGAFVKLGQFAALRYDVLPAWLREGFATLQDRVPALPLSQVRAVVEAELGCPLHEAFPSFEAAPLGAASMAQVHRARLANGEDVAVKVQHPWLEASLDADLALLRWLLGAATLVAGRGRMTGQRLFGEFASALREELDFEREADVAVEIARNLAFEPQIVVPTIVRPLTRRRVLTMSYHHAVRITDRPGLARLGVAPAAVLEILARAYAKQVFVDGLFHADPHPGNLFVLDEAGASARPRVLFVDFGLSRRLDPGLRRELRLGLFALLQRDLEAFVAGMDRMGMIAPGAQASVRAAVEAMFARMQREGTSPLGLSGDQVLSLKDEAKRLLQETPGLQLPNDLLLYAKTLSYLFALGAELDPSVDLVKISVPYLLKFLTGAE